MSLQSRPYVKLALSMNMRTLNGAPLHVEAAVQSSACAPITPQTKIHMLQSSTSVGPEGSTSEVYLYIYVYTHIYVYYICTHVYRYIYIHKYATCVVLRLVASVDACL